MAIKDANWFSSYFNWREKPDGPDPAERARSIGAAEAAGREAAGETSRRQRRFWRSLLRPSDAQRPTPRH